MFKYQLELEDGGDGSRKTKPNSRTTHSADMSVDPERSGLDELANEIIELGTNGRQLRVEESGEPRRTSTSA